MNLDVILGELGGEEELGFEQQQVSGDDGWLGVAGAGELEEVIHDAFEAEDFALDHFDIGVLGAVGPEAALLGEKRGADGAEL